MVVSSLQILRVGFILPVALLAVSFLVCFDFQRTSKLPKAGENIVRMWNSFDPVKRLLDVSSGSKLFAYETIYGHDRQDKGKNWVQHFFLYSTFGEHFNDDTTVIKPHLTCSAFNAF